MEKVEEERQIFAWNFKMQNEEDSRASLWLF